ncbi:MAG TPA: hydantoinase/oxoprolinase family protein, partial [Allosphingosinicella sp.]
SAAGAMFSDVATEYSATVHSATDAFDAPRVNAAIERLRGEAEAFARRAGLPGTIEFVAEARYEGQAWEIDVPLGLDRFEDEGDVRAFRAAFDQVHEQIFTIRDEASSVELVGLRARVRCRARSGGAFRLKAEAWGHGEKRRRSVYFAGAGHVETPVLGWNAFPAETDFAGPAIIESAFTTVVIDPAARFCCSPDGALLIEV